MGPRKEGGIEGRGRERADWEEEEEEERGK